MTRLIFYAADVGGVPASGTLGEPRWLSDADEPAMLRSGVIQPADWPRIRSRFRTAIIDSGGRIVGRCCNSTGAIEYSDWLLLRPQPTDVITSDSYVLPEFRGRRLLSDIKAFAAREYASHGYKRLVSWCKSRNAASIRAHANIGARCVIRLVRWRLFGLSIVWAGRRLSAGFYGPRRRYVLEI